MIVEIIKALRLDDFYGCGDNIEIAKGKNELVTSLKDGSYKIKRKWLQRKR